MVSIRQEGMQLQSLNKAQCRTLRGTAIQRHQPNFKTMVVQGREIKLHPNSMRPTKCSLRSQLRALLMASHSDPLLQRETHLSALKTTSSQAQLKAPLPLNSSLNSTLPIR